MGALLIYPEGYSRSCTAGSTGRILMYRMVSHASVAAEARMTKLAEVQKEMFPDRESYQKSQVRTCAHTTQSICGRYTKVPRRRPISPPHSQPETQCLTRVQLLVRSCRALGEPRIASIHGVRFLSYIVSACGVRVKAWKRQRRRTRATTKTIYAEYASIILLLRMR